MWSEDGHTKETEVRGKRLRRMLADSRNRKGVSSHPTQSSTPFHPSSVSAQMLPLPHQQLAFVHYMSTHKSTSKTACHFSKLTLLISWYPAHISTAQSWESTKVSHPIKGFLHKICQRNGYSPWKVKPASKGHRSYTITRWRAPSET